MTWVTSPITFGGYTFPYGMRLQDRSQDARIDQTDIPFTPGVNAPAGLTGVRTIHLTGIIGGYGAVDSSGAYITTRDQLEAEIQYMAAWLESGYQQLTIGFSDSRYCYAQKSKLKATYREAEQGIIAQIDIELIAQDPRWFSTTVNSTPNMIHGGANQHCDSAGSGIVYPKVTFTANGYAATNPKFTVYPGSHSSSSPYVQIALTYSMGGGDVIVVDCDPQNRPNAVLLNGTPRLDLLGTTGSTNTVGNQSFFPYLVPGNNLVSMNPDASGGTHAYGVLSWSDTYVF